LVSGEKLIKERFANPALLFFVIETVHALLKKASKAFFKKSA
jgi:hypothetical protein